MSPKSTLPSGPETHLPPTDAGKKAGPAAIEVNPVAKSPFKPDLQPSTLNYALPEEVPRLPVPLEEPAFYQQWQYSDRISGLPLVEDTGFFVAWNREDANSYWAAIAHIIYGRGEYWQWVKA